MAALDACETCEPTSEPTGEPLDVTPLLDALKEIDAAAALVPNDTPRFCNGLVACLCSHHAVLHGHRINIGHASLDKLGAATVCARIAATKCSCCRGLRKATKHKQNEKRQCFTCKGTGHLVRDCPQSLCSYCGGLAHLARDCTFGAGNARSQSFLPCGDGCFVRRFVVPLHRARTDFDAADDPREGRIDLAARLVTASLVASQRLRHNSQMWLPFLGDSPPSTLCVTGGTVRGLHPSERDTGAGLEAALVEALTLAREGGTAAPLLILEQGAPPLAEVLQGSCFSPAALRDMVVVLGDDIGLTEAETIMAKRVGAEAAGGGPVLGASFGSGCLLASHCIVLLHHYLDNRHDCPPQLWAGPSEEVHKIRRQQRSRRTRRTKGQPGDGEAVVEGA